MKTLHVLAQKEIGYGLSILPGDCFIASARNRLITEFLESPCTDLFFVDDDLQWHAEDFAKLLEAPFDVVSGIYRQKLDVTPHQYPVELTLNEKDNALITAEYEGNTFYQANSLPAGFLRIRRSVIEKMIVEFPQMYAWPEKGQGVKFHHALFEAGVCYEQEKFHGEDYNFCQKLRSIGVDLWTLPDLHFAHIGKKKYEGNLQHQINEVMKEAQHG